MPSLAKEESEYLNFIKTLRINLFKKCKITNQFTTSLLDKNLKNQEKKLTGLQGLLI